VLGLVLLVTPKNIFKREYLLLFIYRGNGTAAVGLIISFIKSNYVTGWQISVYLPFAMSKYQFAMQKRKIIIKQRIFQMSRTQKLSFSP